MHTCMEPAACHSQTGGTALNNTRLLTTSEGWPKRPRPEDTINLDYLAPLVDTLINDVPSEALVTHVSRGRYTVMTLAKQIKQWLLS